MSALTGESAPVERAAGRTSPDAPLLSLPDLVFSGTLCAAGSGTVVVLGTGRRSGIGRIAALTHRVAHERSPLEEQVRRVAWLVAAVGVGVGVAFLPLGLLAGLSIRAAAIFAVGLLVANVPEGLLPRNTRARPLAVPRRPRALARPENQPRSGADGRQRSRPKAVVRGWRDGSCDSRLWAALLS